jgi:hypothetical protein
MGMLENKLLIEPIDTPQIKIKLLMFCPCIFFMFIGSNINFFLVKGEIAYLAFTGMFNSFSPVNFHGNEQDYGYQYYGYGDQGTCLYQE